MDANGRSNVRDERGRNDLSMASYRVCCGVVLNPRGGIARAGEVFWGGLLGSSEGQAG